MLTMLLKLIKPCFHAAMLLTLLWLLLQLTLLLQPVADPAATACCCSLSLDQTVEIHHAHVALRNCAAPRRLIYRFYCVRTIVGEAAVL